MKEKGWTHLQTGLDPQDVLAVRSLFLAMEERLRIDPDVDSEISIITPREDSTVLANSHQEMSFHTDNVYLQDSCQSVALFCAVQAKEGGHNEIVDGLAVARRLPQEVRTALSEPVWQWIDPRTDEPSPKLAVLGDNAESIRWWRTSLLNRRMAMIAVADALEDAINNSDRDMAAMQPGDILVTDNTRVLHNRGPFIGQRRIYRARFW